jgi:penicillin-binding protein 2
MSEFNLDQFKESCCEEKKTNKWNFIYGFVVLGIAFLFLLGSLINLQLVNGQEYSQRSQNNRLRAIKVPPNRGIIYDRNGKKLVENVAINDIYLDLEQFECEKDQENCEKYDIDKIKEVCETLQKIDETYVAQKISQEGTDEQQYYTLFDKVSISIAQNGGINNVLLIKDSLDKFKIDVLANIEKMPGVFVQEGTKRNYPYKESFGHLLGYVSKASEKDLVEYEYLSKNDLVGKAGL